MEPPCRSPRCEMSAQLEHDRGSSTDGDWPCGRRIWRQHKQQYKHLPRRRSRASRQTERWPRSNTEARSAWLGSSGHPTGCVVSTGKQAMLTPTTANIRVIDVLVSWPRGTPTYRQHLCMEGVSSPTILGSTMPSASPRSPHHWRLPNQRESARQWPANADHGTGRWRRTWWNSSLQINILHSFPAPM